MRCRFCGTPLPDDARFCSGCGREVERKVDSTQEKNSNEPEDAYYRELDDEEYDEIKKREKEAERLKEEAAKERAAREKYAKEEAARRLREEQRIKKEETERRFQEEKRAKEEAEQKLQEEQHAKEEAERRLQEEKRAREEAERKRREEQRVMEESRRQYEEEQRRWRESLKAEEEIDKTKQYRGYEIPSGETSRISSKMAKRGSQQKQRKQQKQQRQSEQQNAQQQPTQQPKSPKKKKPMSALVYFIIIIVGGFALYKCGFPEMVINSISQNSSVSKQKDSTEKGSEDSKNSKDKKEADNTATDKKDKTEATSEEKKVTLADTDNLSMNVDSCLSTDAYNTVISEDGSFSFGYPKYLFNQSEVNENGTSYTLSYKEGEGTKAAELTVYTESNAGNALENAKQLYQRFSSQVNKIYFKMQPTRIDSEGMARTLIGASVDSSETTGVYIIAANDGEKNYILKFTYPDPDMKDDYNQIDYVVDCVYRYCSFSGGTYRPRTYQQFLKDDMGTKK